MVDPKRSFEQNMNDLFFKPNAFFANEYEKVFYSQFREHKTYEQIVTFLSSGPRFLKEVSDHLKMPSGGGLKSYLSNLEKALFISSYVPYDKSEKSKLKKYKLTDEYLRFYFKFIVPNKKIISDFSGSANLFNRLVKSQWDSWTGFAFENFCLKNAASLAQKMDFLDQIKSYGPLFSRGEKGFQVDLIFERFDQTLMVCEMKYYNKPIGVKIIAEFEKKLHLLEVKKGFSVQKVLISQFGEDKALKASEYFDYSLGVSDLF